MGYGTISRDPLGQDKDFPPPPSHTNKAVATSAALWRNKQSFSPDIATPIFMLLKLYIIENHIYPPYPTYILVRGPQDVGRPEEVAKREAFKATITTFAKELGVFISEKHELKIRDDIRIPSHRTLRMGFPTGLLEGDMVLGVWYLPNGRFEIEEKVEEGPEIDKKIEEGPATIILRRDGRDGMLFSGVKITFDDTTDREVVTSVIVLGQGTAANY
ncbi:hypothetical protein V496_01687 [Pseudogymnoascus sp. VKM F-4515 (FW-2607)]|nr:hypothetical protein V496_01687 [Pseudogymnoascus sp. VKM F-4515 (FW-2607)]